MAEDGDPNLPTYTSLDENGIVAWIDLMASRAEELQLPLTHPRFNKGIIWIKKDGITVGREWSRSAYIPEQPEAEVPVQESVADQVDAGDAPNEASEAPVAPSPPNPPPARDPERTAAIAKAEKAADILMDQKIIIEKFFQLFRMGQTGMVALCIQKGLVSPDITDGQGYDDSYGRQYVPEDEEKDRNRKEATRSKWWMRKNVTHPDYKPQPVPPLTSQNRGDPNNGATPLLTAVDAGDAAMVRVLVNLGADINRMARPPDLRRVSDIPPDRLHKFRYGQDDELDMRVRRSPLMLAAAQGRIALVRLFYEELGADDSLVAPDGYNALRLAAHGRHREIVSLLPSRRGGAWLRFSTRHGRAMQRIRKAGDSIVWFTTTVGKLVFWYIPKAVLYHIPKELIVLPLGRLAKYLWQHRYDILPAIGRWLAKLPRRVWTILRDLGSLLVDLAKALGKLVARLPKALKFAGQWLVASLKVVGTALANVVGRAVSAVHTAVVAVLTWFRSITWADVVRGFESVVHAIFIGLPKALWTCVKLFGRFSLMALNAVFGGVAFVIYVIGLLLFHTIVFVPRQIWKILTAIGSSIAAAFHEVVVWFDPKSVV
ncbi:hypothetical protein SEUCBS140593_003924 [Sporothrix eucalyptigena]|uniref:Ankyrin repeat protein n=1 Tax=Sporothrix eucalyptigena TaxID=1812306 RepID=A0ABP0BJ45_9PEZI